MKCSILINQSDPNLTPKQTQHLDVQISLTNGRHKFKLRVVFFILITAVLVTAVSRRGLLGLHTKDACGMISVVRRRCRCADVDSDWN